MIALFRKPVNKTFAKINIKHIITRDMGLNMWVNKYFNELYEMMAEHYWEK